MQFSRITFMHTKMKARHHDLEFDLPDEWLHEAKAYNFKPATDSYIPDEAQTAECEIFYVSFDDVEPLHQRAKHIGVFCKNQESGETARQRVVRILNWIVAESPIQPVKVVASNNNGFKFRLTEGCHRFHCALALGYKKIPATKGIVL